MPRAHSIESRITSLLREARKRTILSPLRAISDGLMPGCITIRHLLICVLSLGINLSAASIPVTRARHPQRHIPSSSAPAALILQNSPWQLDRSGVLGFSALILIEGICIVLLLRNISRRKRAHEGLGRKRERSQKPCASLKWEAGNGTPGRNRLSGRRNSTASTGLTPRYLRLHTATSCGCLLPKAGIDFGQRSRRRPRRARFRR